MSGGKFGHTQYEIGRIADAIQSIVDAWDKLRFDEYDSRKKISYSKLYPLQETLERFREAIVHLRQAEVYANRIDWLLSCDDGEDTFHERLKSDLAAVERRCTKRRTLSDE